jgi:hypothetical protein
MTMLITEIEVLLAAAAVAVCAMLVVTARARRDARAAAGLARELEEGLESMRRSLEAAEQRAEDHARRVAWLESKLRQEAAPAAAAPPMSATGKLNITERRHRVLSLARKGQDAETIAQMLGMPHGEVELIIGLSRVA